MGDSKRLKLSPDSPENEEKLKMNYFDMNKLPNEIWNQILNKIPQNERLKMRVISRDFQEKIDQFSTFDVKINDFIKEKYLERIFKIRVHSCEFSSLKSNNFEPDFQNPSLIKEIIFTTNVSNDKMKKILTTCTQVEYLKFYTTIASDTVFKGADQEKDFLKKLKNLKEIVIGIHQFQERRSSMRSLTYDNLICDLNFNLYNLQSLKIYYSLNHEEWISLFDFLCRHPNINSLDIASSCSGFSSEVEDYSNAIDLVKNINLEKLKAIKFKSIHCLIPGNIKCDVCKKVLEKIFNEIIQEQSTLEIIDISHGRINQDLIVTVLEKNKNTLRSVSFFNIKSEIDFGMKLTLDGSLFEECTSLSEVEMTCHNELSIIIVDLFEKGGRKQKLEASSVLINLDLFPKSIKKLKLMGFFISSADLVNISHSEKFVNLQELKIVRIPTNVEPNIETSGLTYKVFFNFCKNLPDLKYITVDKTDAYSALPSASKWNDIINYANELKLCNNNNGTTGLGAGGGHKDYLKFEFKDKSTLNTFIEKCEKLLYCNNDDNDKDQEKVELSADAD